MVILPKFLQKNDTIALVCTARKIDFPLVENARKHFENWGLHVIVGESATASFHQFSGDDELRTRDFQMQLDNPDVKAIICLRGGFGTARIVDRLDFSEFAKNPKWIVGYSDVTVIQNHILKNYNIASLHAEMALKFPIFPNTNESLNALRNALFGIFEPLEGQILRHCEGGTTEAIHNVHGLLRLTARNDGTTAELVGGNLAILCSLLGSSSEVDTTGKILFLEDVGEWLYAIDRMMTTLKRAGNLEKLAGLAVGQFTNLKDDKTSFGKSAYEIIAEHVADYDYPVIFDIPAGHCEINMPLIFGGIYEMSVSEKIIILRL
ncbi:MAG: LD-carboxypeptidase [Bacteroidales bacterium]|nr:LD-carboxypeptidase [Bacteroidales bacterium]